MKISAQDEYGLRILIRIAKADPDTGLSIPQLSELEGLSNSYVGKLTRALRIAELIESTRGKQGGYILSKPADQITITEAINALGGRLYHQSFCGTHSGSQSLCTNSVDCSLRSLWKIVQFKLDEILNEVTLADLSSGEANADNALAKLISVATV